MLLLFFLQSLFYFASDPKMSCFLTDCNCLLLVYSSSTFGTFHQSVVDVQDLDLLPVLAGLHRPRIMIHSQDFFKTLNIIII